LGYNNPGRRHSGEGDLAAMIFLILGALILTLYFYWWHEREGDWTTMMQFPDFAVWTCGLGFLFSGIGLIIGGSSGPAIFFKSLSGIMFAAMIIWSVVIIFSRRSRGG
jgi:hypothetical protein